MFKVITQIMLSSDTNEMFCHLPELKFEFKSIKFYIKEPKHHPGLISYSYTTFMGPK